MSLVKAFGCSVYGISATTVTVEVNIDIGINFHMVGLPDSAVKESQQRIDAALKNNGFKIPGKKITVNLAPADIRKEGSSYDLPIAMGILCASGQLETEALGDYIIMGELSLDGILRPVRGALPMAIHAKSSGELLSFILNVSARTATWQLFSRLSCAAPRNSWKSFQPQALPSICV